MACHASDGSSRDTVADSSTHCSAVFGPSRAVEQGNIFRIQSLTIAAAPASSFILTPSKSSWYVRVWAWEALTATSANKH